MTAAWFTGQWAPFDLESTGVSVWDDRIVSFCIGRVGGGQGTATRTGIVNPGIPIPPGATAIHRITDAIAEQGQLARDAVEHIAGEVAAAMLDLIPIVGWNVAYDLTMLRAECERYGLPTVQDRIGRPDSYVLDGFVIDKHADPYRRGKRTLSSAAAHYGVDLSEIDAHGAEADAIAAARVTWKVLRRHGLDRVALPDLHDWQTAWAREQADSLRAYFDKKGTQHDGVDGSWPVRQRTKVPA